MKSIVSVKPNSKLSKVKINPDGSYTVFVSANPEKGKANKAVIKLLSDYLKVKPNTIDLVRGHKSKEKIFELSGF